MKKFKKFFAVLLTLAMVLGMSMTTFAAKTTGTITINGLSANGTTTINVYQAVSMRADGNSWEWNVADWANGIIVPGQEGELDEQQKEALANATLGNLVATYTSVNKTTFTTPKLEAGAYVITATTKNGDKTVANYSYMVVSTFETAAGNNTAKDVTATAKVSGINLTKELANGADKVAAYGEKIQFTITTSVPNLKDAESYKIIDTPNGLTIDQVDSITGIDSIKNVQGAYEGTDYVIDLSDLCGFADHMGKVITITYTATVTSTEGYSNTANSFVDDKPDGDGDGETGFTGSITVTKVDSDDSTPLSGAKFTVTKVVNDAANGNENAIPLGENLKFAGNAGSYTYDPNGSITEIEVGEDGKVTISGLDGGTYHFTETQAPEGYQIANNETQDSMTDAVLTEADATTNITTNGNYTNTKLGSLPSTGGIGTTIFTIGGCAIMIIAAGLFFASRRRSAK